MPPEADHWFAGCDGVEGVQVHTFFRIVRAEHDIFLSHIPLLEYVQFEWGILLHNVGERER